MQKKTLKLLQGQVSGLNEQLEEAARNKAKSEKTKRDLEVEIEELKDRVDELDGHHSLLQDTHGKVQTELVLTKKSFETEAETRQNFEDKVRLLEKENEELKARISEILNSGTDAEKNKRRLQTEVEDLNLRLDAENKKRTAAERSIKKAEDDSKAAKVEKEKLAKENLTMKQSSEKAVADARKFKTRSDEVELQLGDLQNELRKLQLKVKDTEENANRFKTSSDKLQLEKEELQVRYNKLQDKVKSFMKD